jgi:2-dehydropantoate 2-reductase
MSQKIAVFGTGANGSCIAANLVAADLDVVIIDQWPAHVEAMRAGGLKVTTQDTELHVPVRAFHVCDVCTFKTPFDIVLLAVKAYDTRWACEMIKSSLAADGALIGVQNAMTAETIRDVIGTTRTVGCVVELASEIFTPGLVKRNTPKAKTWIGIGSLDPAVDGRLAEIEAVLSHVGKVEIKPDILSAKWTKLVINSMSLGTSAMLGTRLGEAIGLPGMRDLMIEIGEESMRVGSALGYSLEPIFGLTREDFAKSNRPMELLFDKLARDIGPGRGHNTVLQDLMKGRPSEVSMINGFVADESARRGYSAPANARVANIVRRIEHGEIKPGPKNIILALG